MPWLLGQVLEEKSRPLLLRLAVSAGLAWAWKRRVALILMIVMANNCRWLEPLVLLSVTELWQKTAAEAGYHVISEG